MNKILTIVGGGTKKHKPFLEEAEKLGLDLKLSSFSDVSYIVDGDSFDLTVENEPVSNFDIIYVRIAGKRVEDVGNLLYGIRKSGVKIVDRIYEKRPTLVTPLPKSIENQMLAKEGVKIPKTFFASLKKIKEKAPEIVGFPFVLKSTRGRKGRDLWLAENEESLQNIYEEARAVEKSGARFIAQEFVEASQRIRALVVGGKVVGAITRPTRWRERFTDSEPIKGVVAPLSKDLVDTALKATGALSLDVAGVDILKEDDAEELYVIEVNQAPRWDSFKKETGVNVEKEILVYLASL